MAMEQPIIELQAVSKSYTTEPRAGRRLWRQLTATQHKGPQYHALKAIDLQIRRGEVVGVIGRNGAGKSTLLQLVCGVLQPSSGKRSVRGRVAALLELGAGFNPELTGRENVRLNGPLLGLSDAEMVKRMDGIVDFSGIQDFIDQPVRSYSSGMFVRLAFSMATSVDPDILVVDEALSVGDGAFARKSYERIMALKDQGVTILFCSHSMFQVEQLCTRALWIESGELRFDGFAHQATVAYSEWLARFEQGQSDLPAQVERFETEAAAITRVQIRPTADGQPFMNRRDALWLDIALRTDPKLPSPTLGVVVCGADARPITSAGSWIDGAPLQRLPDGSATATLVLPEMPLLKGRYTVSVYVLCERALHLNAAAEHAVAFEVTQAHVEQGVVSVPHQWVMESAR